MSSLYPRILLHINELESWPLSRHYHYYIFILPDSKTNVWFLLDTYIFWTCPCIMFVDRIKRMLIIQEGSVRKCNINTHLGVLSICLLCSSRAIFWQEQVSKMMSSHVVKAGWIIKEPSLGDQISKEQANY